MQLQLLLSLSFSLSQISTAQNMGKLDAEAASTFWPQIATTEPSPFTHSNLMAFGFRPLRTIRTKHEWALVLVFLFSALPPSFFVTLTTEAEWRGVSAGEQI